MSEQVFNEMEKQGHEQVIFNYDKTTGLKAIIAIHDTTLGPALGGCRMMDYESEDDALADVLRLSKGMTYKCGVSGVDYGGGKTVIIGDSKEKSEGMFRALGRFVQTIRGRYYTGTDVGTAPDDFIDAMRETDCIVGRPVEYGGGGSTAITTAYGVWQGLKASCKAKYGSDSLRGKKVAIQGLGKVGRLLVKHLIEDEGAKVVATDISKDAIHEVKSEYSQIETCKPDEIYEVDCDIFSPSALGAVINDFTIDKLNCDIVAGSANNQLQEDKHGDMLFEKGILYAPDYVINAGGLIQAADEVKEFNHGRVMKTTSKIYDILLDIYKISKEKQVPTYKAANILVEDRLDTVAGVKKNFLA
ncbi:Glu/Leu/Phe/Val family dehydrogenase [Natranaerobius trueperi]|uniref:Leucine dehydrogenase n=1 Tax=Natranaerobius trueperi TaxID=759412 RepID=A0A226BVV6_9FIRM|nr:Glu/Leu/Phe/Val dehydrogenase [Natranaerobius trueperi]OWZ83178.1 leucine dehydrogenase [Natranaerobius trueperi]